MKINIDYDSENDILYIYSSDSKVDFSIDYDDIILDVSGNKITGIEILDASEKFAKNKEETNLLKKAMDSIKKAYLKVDYGVNSIRVKMGFISSVSETEQNLLIQVPIKRELILQAR